MEDISEPEVVSGNATVPQTEPVATSHAPKKKGLFSVLVAAMLLCGVMAGAWVFGNKPAEPATPASTEAPAQAVVTIAPAKTPLKAVRNENYGGGLAWLYSFSVAETAGHPFTVQEASVVYIGEDDAEYPMTFTGEDAKTWWGSNTLTKGTPQMFQGGLPVQELKGLRLVLTGVDDAGHDLSFDGYLALSKEIAE